MPLLQNLLGHLHLPSAFLEDAKHSHQDLHQTAFSAGQDELKLLDGGKVRVDLLNNNNSQYYGDFTLGNPRQRFTAVFDTGSGITWVPGSFCQSDTCTEHHRFAPSSSSSFEVLPSSAEHGKDAAGATSEEPRSIHYGTGEVKFKGGFDTLTFCDSHSNPGCHGKQGLRLDVPNQPFGQSVHQTSYPFRILPFDGILGLAPSANRGSVLHQLKASKALDKNVFGVYLSEDPHRSGSIDFGGIERAHIAPDSPLHWHRILGDQEWTVAMKDILVNGKPLHICDARPGGVCPAVVDTGSSLITGPTGEVEKLLTNVRLKDDCTNLEKLPEVSLQLVDKDGNIATYPLAPQDYTLKSLDEVPNSGDTQYLKEFPILGNGGTAPEVKTHCDPGLGIMDVPGKKWVIGDTFLRRYYSIFDDDRGLVGFVRSIHPDEAPAAAKDLNLASLKAASTMDPTWTVLSSCLHRPKASKSNCKRHGSQFL